MRSLKKIIINILIAFSEIFVLTACGPKEDEVQYQIGYLEAGQSISQLYDLVGEEESAAYTYDDGGVIKLIFGQQTADGGWVAWSESSNMYAYTEEDVGINSIRFYLARKVGNLQILH